jgi:predicted DNA-binding transcriptional regulator YafY
VPIVPDFTAWLMSWGDAIKILKPKELIINLKRKYQSALDLYE